MEASKINNTKRGDLYKIDPKNIFVEEGFNKRMNFGDQEDMDLKASIKERGVLSPLTCYKKEGKEEGYVLIDGERRWRMTMELIAEGCNIARVPVIIERKKSIEERTFEMLLLNDGKRFRPIELAEAYKRLKQYGYTDQEIAKQIGKSVTHVKDMLNLTNVSKELKDDIKKGDISASTIVKLQKINKSHSEVEKIIKNEKEKCDWKKSIKHIAKKDVTSISLQVFNKIIKEIKYELSGYKNCNVPLMEKSIDDIIKNNL